MGPGDLSAVLAPLAVDDGRATARRPRDVRRCRGVSASSDELALVQTVDFFAPIVDDPYDFGQIAAANALSDVYAMGGQPLTALNIVAFPDRRASADRCSRRFFAAGRTRFTRRARSSSAVTRSSTPSSSTDSPSLDVRIPNFLLTNAGAKPGDRLVLTKPIGNGILATALKRGIMLALRRSVADDRDHEAAQRSSQSRGTRLSAQNARRTSRASVCWVMRRTSLARATSLSHSLGVGSDSRRRARGVRQGATTDGLKRNAEYLRASSMGDRRRRRPRDALRSADIGRTSRRCACRAGRPTIFRE